ncbi:MAG: NAD(P)H-hydrate dehydratase [Bacteroidales bacterium]|nr:NAD(P)H-hydrate dehydratase [Bacteroidales bacterium]
MKILPVELLREADQFTIENEPIASIDLMERAAARLYDWLLPKITTEQQIHVFCGQGNNGGDGLALSRMLHLKGFQVNAYVVLVATKGSPDFEVNLQRLRDCKIPRLTEIGAHTVFPNIGRNDLLIDCLFGSGLNKPVTGFIAGLIDHMNQSGAVVIAVDLPSGLFADQPSDLKKGHIIRADYTLSFQFPKLAFLLPENDPLVGQWEVLPIGLHAGYIAQARVKNLFVLGNEVRTLLKNRPKFSHKGNYGHALLIAGAAGKSGAAILAAKACLRSGAGLLHVHTPAQAAFPLQAAFPEAMVSVDPSDSIVSKLPKLEPFNAIGIGPGLGMAEATAAILKLLIQTADRPLVLDADALNILSENKTWLSFLPPGSILTPHPREFERLAGKWQNSYERLNLQREFSVRYGVFVVFKGAYSTISTPDGNCWFNSTGNPGMATAGAGDVLTGLITGLMAQSYAPLESALLAVYVHGLAGDLAAEAQGMESLIASDIIDKIGVAFSAIRSQ